MLDTQPVLLSAAPVSWSVFALCKVWRTILPVSTLLSGEYGQHGVYASVPAVLGRKGVKEVVELKLTEEEKEKFGESCRIMRENFELAVTWYEKTRKARNDGAASA